MSLDGVDDGVVLRACVSAKCVPLNVTDRVFSVHAGVRKIALLVFIAFKPALEQGMFRVDEKIFN